MATRVVAAVSAQASKGVAVESNFGGPRRDGDIGGLLELAGDITGLVG